MYETNPLNRLNEVVEALSSEFLPVTGTVILYAKDHKIRACLARNRPKSVPVLAKLSSKSINVGMTASEWIWITRQIKKFMKEGVL